MNPGPPTWLQPEFLLSALAAVIVLILLTLASVPCFRARSLRPFLAALGKVLLLVAVPLPVFLLSGLLSPECKRNCVLGWVDCLQQGKIWLLPLVLWAVAALYERDVLGRTGRPPGWVAAGLLWGVAVSGFCLLHFVLLTVLRTPLRGLHVNEAGFLLFLLVPCYIQAWFLWRVYDLREILVPAWRRLAAGLLTGLPCWIAAVIMARRNYVALPESTDCFVVTAASHGHRVLVGPTQPVQHRGHLRAATRQLATFWALEAVWQEVAPRTHRIFRRTYNRLGPLIARRIRTTWRADIVYLLLKPAELLARIAVSRSVRRDFQSLELRPWTSSNNWKSP